MMKLFALAAAAAIAVTSLPFAPAAAQPQRVETQTTRTTVKQVVHGNRGWRTKRVCTTRWQHHRKVRTCRVIRVRRY